MAKTDKKNKYSKARNIRRMRERFDKASFFKSRKERVMKTSFTLPDEIYTVQEVDDLIKRLVNRSDIIDSSSIIRAKSRIRPKPLKHYFYERIQHIQADQRLNIEFRKEKKNNRGLTVIPKTTPHIKQTPIEKNVYEDYDYSISDW